MLLGKDLWLTQNRRSEVALQCLIAAPSDLVPEQRLCLFVHQAGLLGQAFPKLVLRKLVCAGLCARMGRPFLDLQDCSIFGKPHCKGENFPSANKRYSPP